MHELSICTGLVELVSAELERQAPGAKLLKAVVCVGDLRQIVPETLTFAYETLVAGTKLAGSALEIRHVPLTARCQGCGWEGTLTENFFICPKCEGLKLDLLTGRELHLDSLEIEQDEPK
jgi:hydrogenase nickel incorporation protein HypA/HybF